MLPRLFPRFSLFPHLSWIRSYSTNLTSSSSPTDPPKRRNLFAEKAPFTLTDAAANRIKYLLQKRPGALGLKIGVKKRGCNGLSYILDYVAEKPKLGESVSEKGVNLYIEPNAFMFVVGTQMDFIDDEIRSEFVFQNPNSKGSCGCGESFNV